MNQLGMAPIPSMTLSKLAWLRETEPQAAARVERVMIPHDWLTLMLCGEFTTDRSSASGTGCLGLVVVGHEVVDGVGASAWSLPDMGLGC